MAEHFGQQAMTTSPLELLNDWFERRLPEFEIANIDASIAWGPSGRNPLSAWLDFKSSEKSARLMLWSNGEADLMIGDLVGQRILLEEHREITTELGLDDAGETVKAWLAEITKA
jgi:hypothetical protein